MFNVKPKYFVYEEAPLKWFNFIRYFQSWFGLLVFGGKIIEELSQNMSFYLYYDPLVLIIWVADIVMSIKAIRGLFAREWSGVNAYLWVYGLQLLEAANNVFLTLAYGIYDTSEGLSLISNALGASIAALFFIIVNRIYFEKRRPLFTPAITYEITATEPLSDTTEEPNESEEDGLQNNIEKDAMDPIRAIENVEENDESEGPDIKEGIQDDIDEQLADEMVSSSVEIPKQEVLIHVTGKTGKSAWVPASKAKMWLLAEENAYNNIMRMNSEHSDSDIKTEHAAEVETKAIDDKKEMAVESALPEIRFCYHCGYRVLEDALFCEKCGAKIR